MEINRRSLPVEETNNIRGECNLMHRNMFEEEIPMEFSLFHWKIIL
jgi:hypothetical protein